jgi:hypothetical protein
MSTDLDLLENMNFARKVLKTWFKSVSEINARLGSKSQNTYWNIIFYRFIFSEE